MRTTLLVSCAATALLIGIGGANAQAPEHKSAPGLSKEGSAAAGPEKSAMPSKHGMAEHRSAAEAPKAGKDSPKADATSPSNEPKTHQGAANDKASKSERSAATKDKSAPTHQGANDKTSDHAKSAEGSTQKPDTHRSAAENGKQPGSSATKTGRSAATGKSEPGKTDTSKADASKMDAGKTGPSTTGANTTNPANTQTGRSATSTSTERGGSATSVQIDQQKQERIRTALSSSKVENIRDVDFSVSVGTRVPERYHLHALPSEIVDIVPEYRGFDYMVVKNEIVIVNPHTHEIVYTMNEGRSAGMNRPSTDCR